MTASPMPEVIGMMGATGCGSGLGAANPPGGEKSEAIFGAADSSGCAGTKGAGSFGAGAAGRSIAVGAISGVSAAGEKKAEGFGCESISGTTGSSGAGAGGVAAVEAKGSISGFAGGWAPLRKAELGAAGAPDAGALPKSWSLLNPPAAGEGAKGSKAFTMGCCGLLGMAGAEGLEAPKALKPLARG